MLTTSQALAGPFETTLDVLRSEFTRVPERPP